MMLLPNHRTRLSIIHHNRKCMNTSVYFTNTVLKRKSEVIVYVSGLSTPTIVEASIDLTPIDDGIILATMGSKRA